MSTFCDVLHVSKNIILKKIWKVLCMKNLHGPQWRHFERILTIFICIFSLSYLYTYIKPEKVTLNEAKRIVINRVMVHKVHVKRVAGYGPPRKGPFSEKAMINDENRLPRFVCSGTDWVQCYKAECFVVPAIAETISNLKCKYRDIISVNDQSHFLAKSVTVMGNDKYKLNRSDHVQVSCTGNKPNRWEWHGLKAGFRPVRNNYTPKRFGLKNPYNVLIIAFDSTSHNGFIRKMPKTYKYLSKKAVILNSYNIVGDGTSAALYALLTSRAKSKIPDSLKQMVKRPSLSNTYTFVRGFIFYQLMKYGYRTALFEDKPWINKFLQRQKGFRRQPTDHYLRAFFKIERRLRVNNLWRFNNRHCIGAVPEYQLLMNLSFQFLELDQLKFCFTYISDITHSNFVSTADKDFVSRLQNLVKSGAQEDTLVMVLGDNEIRLNGIKDTYQGKLEERLPLVAIILPEKLKRLRPDAVTSLKQNKNVVTTALDLHATILDAIGLKSKIRKFRVPGSNLPRAMSLLDYIPANRSCSDAGVLSHFCTNTKWHNVSQTKPVYKQVALVLARYINKTRRGQSDKCAPRNLRSIEWVLQQDLDLHAQDPRIRTEYYQAKIIMDPGSGVFEGTVTYNRYLDRFTINRKDIIRVNAYGDESSCVIATNPQLSQYCYCK